MLEPYYSNKSWYQVNRMWHGYQLQRISVGRFLVWESKILYHVCTVESWRFKNTKWQAITVKKLLMSGGVPNWIQVTVKYATQRKKTAIANHWKVAFSFNMTFTGNYFSKGDKSLRVCFKFCFLINSTNVTYYHVFLLCSDISYLIKWQNNIP